MFFIVYLVSLVCLVYLVRLVCLVYLVRLVEKWKLHAKRMELPGIVLLFYIVPLIPNSIAGYDPASQRGQSLEPIVVE